MISNRPTEMPARAAAALLQPRRRRPHPALGLLLAVVASLAACRPENTHYSAVSVLCAEAMRIHLNGQNVAKLLRYSERDDGMQTQIFFELTDLSDQTRQAAASCAFSRDDKKRMILVGGSLDGRALDAAEIASVSDQLLRGSH